MHSVLRILLTILIVVVLGAGVASAQSTFDFNLLATSNGQAYTVANDSPISVVGQVGTQTVVTITATYAGSTAATISQQPTVLGSIEFTAVYVNATTPIVLTPGQALTFTVTYAPTNPNAVSAQVEIPYTEPASGGTTVTNNAILLIFDGSSPSFTLSYVFPNASGVGNQVPIQPSGTIPFSATQINNTTTADFFITNVGSGPGTITAISQPPTTSPFKIVGIPLLTSGYTLAGAGSSGDYLQLQINYTPTAVESDTAQFTITYLSGVTATINLTGTGVASTFSYSYLAGTSTTPVSVQPGGTITLPGVTVATTGTQASSTAIVQVTNTGGVSGTINGISISGPGFSLVNPPATPPTLAAGGSTSFTISFTPTQVGTQTGELVVGGAVFTVSSQGIGPQLTFAYASGGTTIPVGTGGAVAFTPIAVSQSEQVTFTVTNSGTSAATISLITTSAPFSVPALGASTLAAGQSITFPITFAPTTVGPVTGVLLVNNTQVSLVGAGTAPPNLPSYSIAGPSGTTPAATLETISLTLANSYPVDLNGVLTLTTSGTFGTDPAVQFSTGSRTVDFVIPANSTNANFAGEGPQIYIQTGTIAESVTLTPSFTTATGGVDVTPTSPTTLQFNIAASAPVVQSLQIANQTTSSFTLVIVGYSPTRNLSSLTVTLNPATGFSFPTSQFPVDLSQASNLWFESSTSQTFGGLFQVNVPFNLTGTVAKNQTLIQSIASVSVTVSNSVGTSNSVSSNLE